MDLAKMLAIVFAFGVLAPGASARSEHLGATAPEPDRYLFTQASRVFQVFDDFRKGALDRKPASQEPLPVHTASQTERKILTAIREAKIPLPNQ